ncbi:hypothetical protein OAD49_04600 [Flavobacteriaceae bacterium]|nr:hypothetical protein [Flavobacteriaceae bacterium]
MKQKLLLMLLFLVAMGHAQDSLSTEEQQRREKNIQAGNPFKKFGYKPKIATLSKGKYLEFHDLDSIVKIGSFSYHVKRKQITGYSVQETKFSEATLRPEIISRWFSPDPLSDEFTSWTPYHFVHNNPINLIDPDGRAAMPPDDYLIKQNGSIEVTRTNDTFDTFSIENSKGESEFIGQFGKNENNLIQLPSQFNKETSESSFGFKVKEGNEYRSFIKGEALASLIGALSVTNTKDLGIVGFSLSDGSSPAPSKSHINGKNGDLRYLRTDKSGGTLFINQNPGLLDEPRQNSFNNALYKYGYTDLIGYKYQTNGQMKLLNHTRHLENHQHHLHLQGYNPNLKTKKNE